MGGSRGRLGLEFDDARGDVADASELLELAAAAAVTWLDEGGVDLNTGCGAVNDQHVMLAGRSGEPLGVEGQSGVGPAPTGPVELEPIDGYAAQRPPRDARGRAAKGLLQSVKPS